MQWPNESKKQWRGKKHTSSCLRVIPDILCPNFFRFWECSSVKPSSVNFALSLIKDCRDSTKSAEKPTSKTPFSANLDISNSESFSWTTLLTSEEDKISSSSSLGHMAYKSKHKKNQLFSLSHEIPNYNDETT